jgi:flagellar L-ring protein precursor FlgH
VLLLNACATPTRGDPEFAPAMPRYVYTPPQDTGSIYQQGTAMLLNEDLKARRVGDMIIVTLEEQTDAQKKAATGTAKTTSTSITNPTLAGKPFSSHGQPLFDVSLESDHAFDGQGQSTQSNSLSGSVTVTVVEVLANGNLVVQGEKWININQGEEYIRLRGIVRPTDISADNTIASTRVANAQIQYSGDSTLADSNNMGWLAKLFNSPWMPF